MSEMMRILDRGYALIWREGRLRSTLIGLGPDFEWIVPDHPEGDVRHGAEAVIEFFSDWRDQFDDVCVDWELHELGPDRVLANLCSRGRGRASGAPVDIRFAQLWTWREGRFVRAVTYFDLAEARRDAGLPTKSLTQLAHEGMAAYRRGGIDAVLPMLSEDVVWEEDPDWPDSETWHGREEVRRGFPQRLDSTSITPEIEEVVEGDAKALVLMRWTAEGRGSGAVADLRIGVIYEFDGELIERARFFLDRDGAREAFEAG